MFKALCSTLAIWATIAAVMAMVASVISFQILAAMGYLLLALVLFAVYSLLYEA